MSSAETSDARISELERVEFSLRNQLREWEDKYMSLRRQNMSAMEKSCELEEVRNTIYSLVLSRFLKTENRVSRYMKGQCFITVRNDSCIDTWIDSRIVYQLFPRNLLLNYPKRIDSRFLRVRIDSALLSFLAGNYTCEVEWSGEPKQIVHYLEIQGCPIDKWHLWVQYPTKRQNELYCEVWKLFSPSSTSIVYLHCCPVSCCQGKQGEL